MKMMKVSKLVKLVKLYESLTPEQIAAIKKYDALTGEAGRAIDIAFRPITGTLERPEYSSGYRHVPRAERIAQMQREQVRT